MFRIVSSHQDLIKVMMIRGIVFIGEQRLQFTEELDAHEWHCIHILGEKKHQPFGAGRIRFDGPWARLERIARQVMDAGADGLDLNIYDLPIDPKISCADHDSQYFQIIGDVRKSISIPVSVKLIPQISSLPFLANKMAEAGCRALVFFNWFLEPDIDIKKLRTFSRKGQANFNQALRWVGLLAGRIPTDIAASGGVRGADDLIKQILAGAQAVQICSLFYQKGLDVIRDLLDGLRSWMGEFKYSSLEDFRGELSFKNQELRFKDLGAASNYFRAQYLKIYSS